MDWLASDRIQIVIIFGLGFLASRVVVTTGAAEHLVLLLVRRVHRHPSLVSLHLILAASALSSFIPNMIAVLTLLPALKLLIGQLTPPDASRRQRRKIATFLACSVIWGANIGGNLSLTGSPANLLLLGFLALFRVPHRESINFLSWFGWGIPMVIVFDLAAWLLAIGIFRKSGFHVPEAVQLEPARSRIRVAIVLCASIFAFAGLVSAASYGMPLHSSRLLLNAFTLIGAGSFVYLLFWRNPLTRGFRRHRPLLLPSDCWSHLPLKGLSFALILVAFFGLIAHWARSAGLVEYMVPRIRALTPDGLSAVGILFVLVVAAIYMTEFMSNSLVATLFFYAATSLAEALHLNALPLFVGIGMASTCAFMSPVATPVNSLAFGEIRDLSLWRMMLAGCALNLVGAVIVTAAAAWLVTWVTGTPLAR